MSFSCTFSVVSFIKSQQFSQEENGCLWRRSVAMWHYCKFNLKHFYAFQKPDKRFISSRQHQNRYLNTVQHTDSLESYLKCRSSDKIQPAANPVPKVLSNFSDIYAE